MDAVVKWASFWRETFKELKATWRMWWPWALAFAAIWTVTAFFIPEPPMHPSGAVELGLALQYMAVIIPMFIAHLLLYIVVTYLFTTAYLRHVVKTNPPEFNVNNFFFWFGRCLAKHALALGLMVLAGIICGIVGAVLRPHLSANMVMLITVPIILVGSVFYYRALLRWLLVTPLAILRREPVLQRSWNLTKGHCWRIFGNLLMLMLVLFVGVVVILIIPQILVLAVAAPNAGAGHNPILSLMRGFCMGIGFVAGIIYICTVYRILLQEQKNTGAAGTNPASLTTAI